MKNQNLKLDNFIWIALFLGINLAVNAQEKPKYQDPSYAKPDATTEQNIEVKTDTLRLGGTFTFPKNKKNFPVLIFVHGSGPNDRDESIGPNKTFRDLALGLAAEGIASIRYDKRTKVYGRQMAKIKSLTVKEETMDDALSAVALAKTLNGVNPKQIYVLGHSLGGMLAPRIASMSHDLAGIILMAGNARPLDTLIVEQITRGALIKGKGSMAKMDSLGLQKIKSQIEKQRNKQIKEGNYSLGVPIDYWYDLDNYQPTKIAKSLIIRMLVMQGEADIQVTMIDFQRWKDALAGMKNVQFQSYPALSHLFMKTSQPIEKDMGEDYFVPQHVPENVIQDIAKWVKNK